MADVEFIDNRVQINRAIDDAIGAFLLESSAEIVAAAARNSRVDSGQLKGSWKANVNETKGEAVIGSELENAIWEEFGTGEYAIDGKGHGGGYWVFVKDGGNSTGDDHVGKRYTLQEAKQIVAMLRDEGLDAYYTKGKKPNRTLQRAFDANKGKIIRRAKTIFKEALS